MRNVLIVMEEQSYLVTSIQEQLKMLDYQVILSHADMEEIHQITEPVDAMLLYIDGKIIENQQVFVFIRDKAIEEEIPVFMVCNEEDLNQMEEWIPKHVVQREFLRPIDVKKIVKEIDDYIRQHGKHNKKKILVVDDSGAMLRSVKGWLGDKYQVIMANSGAMAIKYLALDHPDLVLLDYEMPVVDGKQVLEMIRTETEFSDVPVIFLTSKDDRESVMKVMALKPEGYLLKTMKPERIVQAVDEFFEKKKGL